MVYAGLGELVRPGTRNRSSENGASSGDCLSRSAALPPPYSGPQFEAMPVAPFSAAGPRRRRAADAIAGTLMAGLRQRLKVDLLPAGRLRSPSCVVPQSPPAGQNLSGSN